MNIGKKSVSRATRGERVLRGNLEGEVRERISVGRDDLCHNQRLWTVGTCGVNVKYVNPCSAGYWLLAIWLHEFKIAAAEVGHVRLAQVFSPAIPDRLRDGEHATGAEAVPS